MKIQIKKVDEKRGIVQITTTDERWYQKGDVFVPSVTWIAGFYPKGIPFYKWLAEKGWDEAEAIKSAAGDKGSKVHRAVEDIVAGKKVKMDDKYLNPSTQEMEELTPDEYECIYWFVDWINTVQPKIISNEVVVFNEKEGYAGTVDLVCEIKGRKFIVDVKTAQSLWPEYELQISAYKHASQKPEDYNLAILQIGYRRNSIKKWKFTEMEDKFDLFLSAKKIWANETNGIMPLQRDYPLILEWDKKQEPKVAAKKSN